MASIIPGIGKKIREGLGLRQKAVVPDIPTGPSIEDTAAASQDEADRIRRRQGRAAAILNNGSTPTTASKYLLGG